MAVVVELVMILQIVVDLEELRLLQQRLGIVASTEVGHAERVRQQRSERRELGVRRHMVADRVLEAVAVREDCLPGRTGDERDELLRRRLVLARLQDPGTGHVDWDGIFRALSEIDYQGYAALESFVDATDNMDTWVWRQLAPDGDTLVREGTAFIRKMMAKYGL